jgi:Tfp pilus assembly protein PilP
MKMKPAITMTAAVLVSVLASGLASAQSPSIIQNARDTMNGVSSKQTAASNQALGLQQSSPAPTVAQATSSATHAPAKTTAIAVKAEPSRKHADAAKQSAAVGVHHNSHVKAAVMIAPSAAPQSKPAASTSASAAGSAEAENTPSEQQVVPDSKYAANGRRDPFVSPVVSHAGGSGCSTGKKCLEIGAINLRGVVHSQGGFIAVVSNNMNKAYFLKENDPVFNGYVVKITGDSIVFQETLQDRLGKTFTREVVKKITTPAV